MEKNYDERIKKSFSLTALISVSFLVLFLSVLGISTNEVINKLVENHMLFYAISLTVFAAALLIFRMISKHITVNSVALSTAVQTRLTIILSVLMIAVFVCQFISSENDPFNDNVKTFRESLFVFFPIFILVAGGGIAVKLSVRKPHKCVFICYVAAFIITFFSLLFVDIFQTDTYHASAYIQSIINVCHGVPYDIFTTGIYGHYALICAPFVILLGGSGTAISCLIAFLGALTTLLCAYIIDNIVMQNYLKILSVFSCIVSVATIRTTAYYQLQPHRILFPLLIVAAMVYIKKKKITGAKALAVGYAISTAGIIWNTEMGFFCALAFSAGMIIEHWKDNRWYDKSLFALYLKCLAGCVGSLLSAVAAVNIYNLVFGGQMILRDFFFPLFDNDYMIDVLEDRGAMKLGNMPWTGVLIILIAALLFSLSHTLFSEIKKRTVRLPL